MGKTLEWYNDNAARYAAETVDTDMRMVCDRFLALVRPGGRVLDLGCGSGRDLKYFREQGFEAEGLDGSAELCKLAADHSGCPVQCCSLEDWIPAPDLYDGIWCCAVLHHLPEAEIGRFFAEKLFCLREGGVLYFCGKSKLTGARDARGRWFSPFTEELARVWAESAGLEAVDIWVSGDSQGRAERWVNCLARRIWVTFDND